MMRIMPDFICLTTSNASTNTSRRRVSRRMEATRMLEVTISLPCIICLSIYRLLLIPSTRPPYQPNPTQHHQTPHNVTSALFPTDHHRSGHPIHGDRRRRRSTVEVARGDEVFRSRCVDAFACLSRLLENRGWDMERRFGFVKDEYEYDV